MKASSYMENLQEQPMSGPVPATQNYSYLMS